MARDLLNIRSRNVVVAAAALTRIQIARLDHPPEFLNLVSVNRTCTRDDLEAVVLRRIVASGDHDATVATEVLHRVVQKRRGDLTHIGNFATRGYEALHDRVAEAFGTEPDVSADTDPFAVCASDMGPDRAAQFLNSGAEQLGISDSADVILAENCRFQHYIRV